MSIDLALRWITAVAIDAMTIWELGQLARNRKDRPLRALVLGMLALAFAATVGIPDVPFLDTLQDAFGEQWPSMINGCWMVMAYSFASYFLLANTSLPLRSQQRRFIRDTAILLVLLVLLAWSVTIVPDGPPHTHYRAWQYLLFNAIVGIYPLVTFLIGGWRAKQHLRQITYPWTRAALWLVILGAAAMAIGVNAVGMVKDTIHYITLQHHIPYTHTLYSIGQLGGQLLLTIGFPLAPLATRIASLRDRSEGIVQKRYARRIRPTWQRLSNEFPHIRLEQPEHETPTNGADFHTITAEITDGLAELARDAPHPERDTRDPIVAAELVTAALQRRHRRRVAHLAGDGPEPPEPPYPRIEPDFDGSWRERARWMVTLTDELQKRNAL